MKTAEFDRALNRSVAEGALATAMGTLLGGVFLTGFALHLGASRFQIGVLAGLPAFASLAQLVGVYFIERTGRSKRLCVGATFASRGMWFLIALTPAALWGFSGVTQTWFIIGWLALARLLGSGSGVAWLWWIKRLVPHERRVNLFSRRHLYNTALSFAMSMAGAVLLDAWNHFLPGTLGGFLLVFALAMFCGLLGAWILSRIPEPEVVEHVPQPYVKAMAAPLKEQNFRRLMTFYAVWNFSSNLAAPFFAVYMLEKLEMPFWMVTVLATTSSMAGLVMNGFWARLKEKFGIRPIVLLATLGDAFMPLCWLFVGPQALWLIVPVHLFGAFSAPLAMGPNNLVLKLAPEKNSSPYLAVFSAMTGPVNALGAIVGGWLAGSLTGEWLLGPVVITGLQLLFLVSGLGRLASLGLLYRVAEPKSERVVHVFRVLQRAGSFRRMKRLRLRAAENPADQPTTITIQTFPASEPLAAATAIAGSQFGDPLPQRTAA
jgi:MFS family permease